MRRLSAYLLLLLLSAVTAQIGLATQMPSFLSPAYDAYLQGKLALSAQLTEKAKVHAETLAGPERITALRLVAEQYLYIGAGAKGFSVINQAIALSTPNTFDWAKCKDVQGALLQLLNRSQEAEKCMSSARKVFANSTGKKRYHLAVCDGNIAALRMAQNDFSGAIVVFEGALPIFDHEQLEKDEQYFGMVGNYGAALSKVGRLKEAEDKLLQSERYCEQHMAIQNPQFKGAVHNLSVLYKKQLDAAIKENADPFRPQVAKPLVNLASSLKGEGKYADAEKMFALALNVNKKILPAGHQLIGIITAEYIDCLEKEGKKQAADELKKTIPSKSWQHYLEFGKEAAARGDDAEAENRFFVAEQRTRVANKDTMDTVQCLNELLQVYYRTNQWEKAASTYARMLPVLKSAYGAKDPAYEKSVRNYAAILTRLNRNDEATKALATIKH